MATLAITTSSTCSTKPLTVFSQSTPQPSASRKAGGNMSCWSFRVLPDPNDYRAVQYLLVASAWKGTLQLCCQFPSPHPSCRFMSPYCLVKLKQGSKSLRLKAEEVTKLNKPPQEMSIKTCNTCKYLYLPNNNAKTERERECDSLFHQLLCRIFIKAYTWKPRQGRK